MLSVNPSLIAFLALIVWRFVFAGLLRSGERTTSCTESV